MNKLIFVMLILGVILIMGCTKQGSEPKPTTTPTLEDQIIVKQFGGAALLTAECADKNYISKTADYIVEGVVEKTEARWSENEETGRHIITYVDFSIGKYAKGSPFGNKLQIEALGGCVKDICESVEDMPIFQQGKQIRIYFHKTETEFWIVCAQMGVEEIEDIGKDEFCEDGTPIGKCNWESDFFFKYCSENGELVEDCTQCGCPSTVHECNAQTKKCDVDSSKRCPPYETPCDLNEESFVACESSNNLKLKDDLTIGVVVVSQFSDDQFPYSYLHLIKDELSEAEKSFFEEDEYLQGKLDNYKLEYINTWMKNQAKRILGNEDYANWEFMFSTKEVCYLGYDDYHIIEGPSPPTTSREENKLLTHIKNNCLDGLDISKIDVILILAFQLDGAETIREVAGLGKWRGGVAGNSIFIGEKQIPVAWADVTTLTPFCQKREIPEYEKCKLK